MVKRIHDPEFGPVMQVQSFGISSGFDDPPMGATLESRLQHLVWTNDIAMGCDYLGNYDIHAIDAALWIIGERPVSACGSSRVARPNPHGDSHDVCSVVYRYANGVVHNHFGQGLPNLSKGALQVIAHGAKGHGQVHYTGDAFLYGLGKLRYKGGKVANLYKGGAERNIATFHRQVIAGEFTN